MVLKAELHCHVEGTAAPSLVQRMAQKNGFSTDGLIDADGRYIWHDFTSFLNAYDRAAAMFISEDDYAEMAYDYFSRSASQGMIYGEVFISADHAENAGLSYIGYVEALAEGINRAKAESGIEGRMIATCVRHYGPERAEPVAQMLQTHPHPMVTGFGMAGDERMHQPSDFAKAFDIARDTGLQITAHAGEFGGPKSILAVLDDLGVKRIGHGVRAIEDPDLVARLVDEQIVLEVCPGSNISLEVFPSWASHPIIRLRDAGVKITVSSDDPPFFHTDIAREYERVQQTFSQDNEQMLAFTKQSVDAAFVDETTRERLLKRLGT